MRRLDPKVKQLVEQLNNPDLNEEEHEKVEKELKKSEDALASVYHTVALHFADIHDTPGRMQEKGVISVRNLLSPF